MSKDKSISEVMIEEIDHENIEDMFLDELMEEIEMINDPNIKSFVRAILIKADPFWDAPATYVPIFHPPDEHEPGGLVLHTKRVVNTVVLLSHTFDCSFLELDCLIAAALLHDVTKAQWRDETKEEVVMDAMHPYTLDAFISWITMEESSTAAGKASTIAISNEILHKILRIIRCSHGKWSPIPETYPHTMSERILHMADLVASNLHTIIDGDHVVEQRWIP